MHTIPAIPRTPVTTAENRNAKYAGHRNARLKWTTEMEEE
jgi:hypothetical protein